MSTLSLSSPLHQLELELSIEEYQQLLIVYQKKHPQQYTNNSEVKLAIIAGQKTLEWVDWLNKSRSTDIIRLSSKQSTRGIPISQPHQYSPRTIAKKNIKIKQSAPKIILDIVYKNQSFSHLDISDTDFINTAKKIVENYKTATRWQHFENHIPYLKSKAKQSKAKQSKAKQSKK